jgi:hypothetical protein
MPHFRITLEAFGDSYDERQLVKWANRFFVETTWKKPIMHAKLAEDDEEEYTVKKLQCLLANNLRNWGAKSSKRYRCQWIVKISPWEFSQASPSKALLAEHRLRRLAAIFSPEAAGLRALKTNAEVALTKFAMERSKARLESFDKTFEEFKRHHYNDAEQMVPMKVQEQQFIDDFCIKKQRYEEAVERDAKRRRV